MKAIKYLIFAYSFLLLGNVAAAESFQTGTVVSVHISSKSLAGGNPTHIQLTGTWNYQPACATTGLWAIDTDTAAGASMLVALMTAMKSGKTVNLRDLNASTCSLRPDMADLKQIDFFN